MTAVDKQGGRQSAKRRTAEEGAAFRKHLIATAKALFVEEGYAAVSIRKIADRAGCPAMTFYVYFRNKLELLRHIWDDVLQPAADHAEAAAATQDDTEAALEAFVCTWCRYWMDNPDNYRLVFFNQDTLTDSGDRYYTDTSNIRDRFLTMNRLIERGVAEGRFAEVDPELAAQSLLALAVGVVHCVVVIPEYLWRPEMPREAVRQAIRGLRRTAA